MGSGSSTRIPGAWHPGVGLGSGLTKGYEYQQARGGCDGDGNR